MLRRFNDWVFDPKAETPDENGNPNVPQARFALLILVYSIFPGLLIAVMLGVLFEVFRK